MATSFVSGIMAIYGECWTSSLRSLAADHWEPSGFRTSLSYGYTK
jgi:hypothetical protein